MDLAVVVNPIAGRGRGAKVRDSVVARFEAAGATVHAVQGTDAADAEARCREAVADRPDALVAIGGDGMVHIAVQAAAQSGVPLGIVPAGTGNDLASCLALPVKNPAAAADIVLAGHTRKIDAVRVGERWFGCVLGAGFDAAVNAKANAMSWPHGTAKYVLATLSTLRTFKPIAYTLTIDGEEWQTSAMMVAVGNARSYGGGMRIVPDASLDDGLLDVCVLEALSVPAFLRAFPKVFSGTHGTHPKVTLRTAKTITIDGPRVTAYADGEPFGTLPLTCEVVPEALTVVTGG